MSITVVGQSRTRDTDVENKHGTGVGEGRMG